ncbi:hypothetical protein LCGC14_0823470 [marine sediment metagenome]|uniref:Uncharacterized protein n=1 Tax=marine sediment metagenome TaxID=412755 RepID=A0A0F9PMQ7_9ZZZZ
MNYRPIFSSVKDYFKTGALIMGTVLLLIIWIAVSMTDGCPAYDGTGNVRSGAIGHGYQHDGKYRRRTRWRNKQSSRKSIG